MVVSGLERGQCRAQQFLGSAGFEHSIFRRSVLQFRLEPMQTSWVPAVYERDDDGRGLCRRGNRLAKAFDQEATVGRGLHVEIGDRPDQVRKPREAIVAGGKAGDGRGTLAELG